MDREQVLGWLAGYERAWRSAGLDQLAELFTPDASYLQGPYQEPHLGLAAIGRMWDETRDGPEEIFTATPSIVAVDGQTAVVRVEVTYGDPVHRQYRDLWIMQFGDDGRCTAFEEWPFWPDQPYTAD
ncbi:MAG: nuclear transport factor 2 family protein [Nakamurella sp.]